MSGVATPDILQGQQGSETPASQAPVSGSLTKLSTSLKSPEEGELSNSGGADEAEAPKLIGNNQHDPAPHSPEENGRKGLADVGVQNGSLPTLNSTLQGASSQALKSRTAGQTSENQSSVDDLFAGLTFE